MPALFFLVALLLTTAAAQTLRVAYIGSTVFNKGWEIAGEKIASIGGFPVNKGSATFGITTLWYMLDDSASSNPYLDQNITSAVANAAAADADIIITGSSRINRRVMELAEPLSIPNIHCSGGNPVFWQSTQPHSFGMHVPFPWYSKGAISTGKVRGLRTLAVVRSFQWQFPKTSGLAALEWARDAGYTVIGPTVQWCTAYAHLTGSCRLVTTSSGQRCVCAEQSEADSLGYTNLKIEEFPSLYELSDDKIVESDFGNLRSAKVSPNMVAFVEGIIDDIRSQGADPEVIACWVENHRSVLYAAMRKNLNPKMWVGTPNKAGTAWPGVQATMHGSPGADVLETEHVLYTVTGMQWNPALRLSDPVFNTNAEYVAQFQQKYGKTPSYDEAACTSAGSVIYFALNKYTPSLDVASVASRRQSLRLGIGDLNDNTLYGMTRFNRGGQNNGRGAVAVQFLPEGSGGAQRVVLPSDIAEETLVIPFPTWESKFGCSPGSFNTGTECTACDPGRFNPNMTAGLAVTACAVCPRGVGTNASSRGATQCGPCAPGYVQDGGLHQGICRGCAAGTFRNATMPSASCELCASGRFSDVAAMQDCDHCPTGTYQSDRGQTTCICELGWYRNPAATRAQPCLSCESILPGATTRHSGSVSPQECTCDRGSYRRNGACRSCEADFPKDSVACNGFGAQPMLKKGWMTRPGEFTVYLCPGEGDGCPGGVPVGVERCGEGGSDIACAWCGDGYRYSQSQGKCISCGHGGVVLWVVFACGSLSLFFVLRPPTVEYSSRSLSKAIRNSFVTLTLSQIVDVLQLYAIYASTAIQFSNEESSMLSIIGGVFSLDTLSPLCGIRGNRSDHALKVVLIMNMIPAFLIVWVVVLSIPAMFSQTLRNLRFPSAISGCNLCLGTLVSFFTTVLNLAINLTTASYAHPKANLNSLLAFPYLTDQAPEMTNLHIVSGCAIFCWCICTMAVVVFFCWYLQTDRPSTLMRRCTVALAVRHRDGAAWWLVVELLQKFLVAISVGMFKRADTQMQWMAIVFFFYEMLLVKVMPYRFLRHSWFDIAFTFSKFLMLVLSVTGVHNRAPSSSGILMVIVITLTICLLDAIWCLLSFVTGQATNTEYDRDLVEKVKKKSNLHLDPFTIGEALPDEDLGGHLAPLRNTRSRRGSLESQTGVAAPKEGDTAHDSPSGRVSVGSAALADQGSAGPVDLEDFLPPEEEMPKKPNTMRNACEATRPRQL